MTTAERATIPPAGRCLRCGTGLDLAWTGRPRLYCGQSCRQAAKKKRDQLGPNWWLEQPWVADWREQQAASGPNADQNAIRQPRPPQAASVPYGSWLDIYGCVHCPACQHGYHADSHPHCPRCGAAKPGERRQNGG